MQCGEGDGVASPFTALPVVPASASATLILARVRARRLREASAGAPAEAAVLGGRHSRTRLPLPQIQPQQQRPAARDGEGGAKLAAALESAGRARRSYTDSATLTDVCCGGELPEVEIISLLEEQIPRYRLRADTLTQFTGYENKDWYIPAPALRPDDIDLNLNPDQIREALNYFHHWEVSVLRLLDTLDEEQPEDVTHGEELLLEDGDEEATSSDDADDDEDDDPYEYDDELPPPPPPRSLDDDLILEVLCSNRVSQMTKTYNDIEAVTRLLEEKEKDLELTARIGKELLAHNQKLETNVASLEAELKAANEKLTQLSHELVKKTELIQILTNDVDESGSEGGTPTSLRCINVELMQRRIGSLEEENKQLRREASQLASDTAECENAEQRLVQDIAQQLANSSMEVEGLSEELDRCKDENRLQQDQIATLTAKLADAEQKLVKLGAENETLTTQLTVSREVQAELASELADSKDRYNEVLALLRDAQEQLRKQRKRGQPTVRGCGGGPLFSTGTPQPDSLASELLETSLYSELSTDSGIGNDRGASYRKVFETVRCASRNSNSSSDSPLHVPRCQSMLLSTSTTMSSGPRVSAFAPPTSAASHLQSSRYYSSSAFPSLDSVGTAHSDYDSSLATTDTEESYPGAPRTGVPGVPGAADLEAAVRRLTPAEIIARRATLGAGPIASNDYESNTPPNFLPYGCRTPDSIMSTGSSGYSGHSGAWRLPEKLQIVKPMEGSLTLAAWSQLATPTLGGLLEERPGVKIRGGRPLEDLGLEMYTLSDLEEDEEYENPGKSFQNTGSVYTLTNSTVLHPDDNTNVTSSVRGSQMCTAAPSRTGTAVPPTPVTRSRRNSTSTFSTTLGLAKLLNERGIRAVTPSTVCTPCSTFSPTATPCNSPDGSPRSSPPPSPPPFNPIKFPGFLSSGADFLRRTFSAEADKTNRSRKSKRVSKLALSRQEKKALSGIRLVERLESIGLDTILTTSAAAPVAPLPLQGSLYTRHHLKSPMAQLTCLKTAPVVSAQEKEPPPSPKPLPTLGVPARPGTGALDERPMRPPLKRQATAIRPDLGVVPPLRPQAAVSAADVPAGTVGSSALGTVSQLLFGRKGGLL